VGLNDLVEERSHLSIGKARGQQATQAATLELTPLEGHVVAHAMTLRLRVIDVGSIGFRRGLSQESDVLQRCRRVR
jgi:hypothetical protein